MIKIGDFARLSRVPIKTLRYYDEIGLLKPREINRYNRYRFYSAEQLPRLYRILSLKELGFSLEQIADLLQSNLSAQQIRRMLEKRRAEIEQQIGAAQNQLAQVEARLRQIETQGSLPDFDVLVKQVPHLRAAVITGFLSGYDQIEAVLDELFSELITGLQQNAIQPTGPGFVQYYDADSPDEGFRIDAAFPIPPTVSLRQHASGASRIHVAELPTLATAVSTIHHGSYSTLGEAYRYLYAWIPANGYRNIWPSREIYLQRLPGGDPNQFVTEIQIPVRTRKEDGKMEPKIVTMDAFKVVGMRYLGKNEHGEISELWSQFNPRIPEIKHLAPQPNAALGVCLQNNQGLIDYIAALPVSELSDIPEGMTGEEIPTQTYAVFESRGVKDIGKTYQHILKEWLPGSGYQPGDGADFEFYPETFNPEDPESLVLIYMPVKK